MKLLTTLLLTLSTSAFAVGPIVSCWDGTFAYSYLSVTENEETVTGSIETQTMGVNLTLDQVISGAPKIRIQKVSVTLPKEKCILQGKLLECQDQEAEVTLVPTHFRMPEEENQDIKDEYKVLVHNVVLSTSVVTTTTVRERPSHRFIGSIRFYANRKFLQPSWSLPIWTSQEESPREALKKVCNGGLL